VQRLNQRSNRFEHSAVQKFFWLRAATAATGYRLAFSELISRLDKVSSGYRKEIVLFRFSAADLFGDVSSMSVSGGINLYHQLAGSACESIALYLHRIQWRLEQFSFGKSQR